MRVMARHRQAELLSAVHLSEGFFTARTRNKGTPSPIQCVCVHVVINILLIGKMSLVPDCLWSGANGEVCIFTWVLKRQDDMRWKVETITRFVQTPNFHRTYSTRIHVAA